MVLKTSNRLGVGGAYADLFRSDNSKLVFKVFVGPKHPSKGYAADDEQRRRNTFEAEYRAYSIVSQDPALSAHAPGLFEKSIVDDVLDHNGISVRGHYLIDCCYRMQFIAGDEHKI